MKINEKHLKELRNCELYQHMLPRYQKSVEWIIKRYIELTEEENIETTSYFVTKQENGAIKLHSPLKVNIIQRRLLNLNDLGFDFGLQFTSDHFMPFFGEGETALFSSSRDVDEIENGDICLIKLKLMETYYLATKEETGFFDLDCSYLGLEEEVEVLGKLVNIETR